LPENPLWARNWAKFGNKALWAALGDVLVFSRDGGGHVGLYVGEDNLTYYVLGGNQEDQVCIARLAKNRCIAVRHPPWTTEPKDVRPIRLVAAGVLSTNEA
jgi:uncharacterized protein (TIGR02594 family)